MKHRYYLSTDLDELQCVHDELVDKGVQHEHVHVWTDKEYLLPRYRLLPIHPLLKTDVIDSTIRAAVLGSICSFLILFSYQFFGTANTLGIFPYACGALVALGLITWEGGMWGIQKPNSKFSQYSTQITQGQHLLLIDFDEHQEKAISEMESAHHALRKIDV